MKKAYIKFAVFIDFAIKFFDFSMYKFWNVVSGFVLEYRKPTKTAMSFVIGILQNLSEGQGSDCRKSILPRLSSTI